MSENRFCSPCPPLLSWSKLNFVLAGILLAPPLCAQHAMKGKKKPAHAQPNIGGIPLSQEERQQEAVIEANRKGAKPRPIAPGIPLSPEEKQREAVFQSAKQSVVFINALPPNVAFENPQTGQWVLPPPGTGSGFVWDERGHVVTNYHVIAVEDQVGIPRAEAKELRVSLQNGKQYQARVIGRSIAFDIAVLQVFAPSAELKPLSLGTSKHLRVGQSVLALGNPFGYDHTLTTGIISSLGREILTAYKTPLRDVIQTDAAINPGNSGGPLMDMSGRLIGMNAAITSTSGSSAGVGFAIPADTLNRIVPELIEKGVQGRPEIGFDLLPPEEAYRLLGVKEGLAIVNIVPDSHAAKAGLRPFRFDTSAKSGPQVIEQGDLVISLDGKRVASELYLFLYLMEMHPKGKPFLLEILRKGQHMLVSIDPWQKLNPTKSKTPSSKKPDNTPLLDGAGIGQPI